MNDIAAHAGVSQATVSYVLNDKQNGNRVGQGTRQRVLDAAAELGYHRNEIARSMATGKTHVLGVVGHAPQWQRTSRLLAGALDEADERGYFIKLVRWNREEMRSTVDRCLALRLDGVIDLIQGSDHSVLAQEMRHCGVPVASVTAASVEQGEICVRLDEMQAARAAANHLVQLGHRRIVLLLGHPDDERSAGSRSPYRTALRECGVAVHQQDVLYDDYNSERTEIVIRELFENVLQQPVGERPTAVICYRDLAALVVMRTLRRCGLQVPHDVSVVGCSDFSMAAVADPPLTTLRVPYYEMGRVLARHLIEAIEGGQSETDNIVEQLPAELVVRESTAVAIGST
jgi:DNA-binding LacI/PurR family transcriptional regulator